MNKKPNQEEQEQKRLLWFLWLHDLFDRYYNKQTSQQENELIKKWKPEADISLFESDEAIVKKGVQKVWKNLADELGIHVNKKPINRKVVYLQRIMPYVAAVLVIMSFITAYQYHRYDSLQSLSYLFSDKMEYRTGKSMVKEFALPDGTVITLNDNTTLTLVKNEFNEEIREVWLTEGEVFFDVVKNAHKRFIIHAQDADVVVKGTSFSVTSYATLNKSSVAVKTGKVQVIRNNATVAMLLPSQRLMIDKRADTVTFSEIAPLAIAGWKDGNLNFSHADGKEVTLRLEQHFNISVQASDDLLKDIYFSASFKKETSLLSVLGTLTDIYQLKYTIKNNTVTLTNQ